MGSLKTSDNHPIYRSKSSTESCLTSILAMIIPVIVTITAFGKASSQISTAFRADKKSTKGNSSLCFDFADGMQLFSTIFLRTNLPD